MAHINDSDAIAREEDRRQREAQQAERRAAMLQRGPVEVVTITRPVSPPPQPPPLVQQYTASSMGDPSSTSQQHNSNIGARPAVDAPFGRETTAAAAAAATPGHYYYPNEGVIVMPMVARQPQPPGPNATADQYEQYNLALVAAQRQQALEEYLDLIYQFVGFVAQDLGAGYQADQFWKGEASGRAALHSFLLKAEQHWLDQQMIDPTLAGSGRFHGANALAEAERLRASHLAGGASRPSSGTGGPSVDKKPQNVLEAMLDRATSGQNPITITEPMLRAYDMLYYHNGEYIPPNGHEVQTPRETIEVALKLAQLERFFLTTTGGSSSSSSSAAPGGDGSPFGGRGYSIIVDGSAVHEIFLDPSMAKGIEDATRFVHDACRRAHIAQIDLMTHRRVRTNFSRLVASLMNYASELNPRRPVQSLSMRLVARNQQDLRRYFESVDYASDGFLANMNTFDAAAETRRHGIEAERSRFMLQTGTYYSDVNRPFGGGPAYRSGATTTTSAATSLTTVVAAPVRIGQSMEAARRHLSSAAPAKGEMLRRPTTPANFALSPASVPPTIITASAAAIANTNVVVVPSERGRGRDRDRERDRSSPSPQRRQPPPLLGDSTRRGRVIFAQDDG